VTESVNRKAREGQSARLRASLWLGLVLIISGAVLVALWGGLKYWHVRTCLDSSLARLRDLQDRMPGGTALPGEAAMSVDLVGIGVQLHGLQGDLACLRAQVQEFLPLAPLVGALPEIGPLASERADLANAPVLLEMAQYLVDGGVLILDGLSPLLMQLQPDGPVGSARNKPLASELSGRAWDLPQAVAALDAARPSLALAEIELQRAAELQTELKAAALSPRFGRLLDLTERYLPVLQMGVKAAQIAPELLGTDGERTYLILAQNDDERRPTGGWISGMGLLTVAEGRILGMSFRDSWSVDNLEVPHDVPPESLHRVLWAGIWLFRDANWSPDFPASAQVAERILERDQGISVDGVIAVDQKALQLLVTALEPLAVDPGEEPISGATVLAFIRDSWTEPQEGLGLTENWQEWTAHRKDFMAHLVEAMLDRMQNQPESVDLSRLAGAFWQALQERHILIYLDDPESAELLASQQWDGALLGSEGDYLQVVDANVGFNKVDPNVQRRIHYQVDLTNPGQAQAETVVYYENNSQRALETCLQEIEWLPTYAERMHGCYWDYVRFYVPVGARLLTTEREPLPPGSLLSRHRFTPLGDAGPDMGPVEKGKVPFGVFFVLGPGEQREVRLAWRLAPGTVEEYKDGWRYQLLVQKQSGTAAIPLQVTVSLPPAARLGATSPEPFSVQGNDVNFDLVLGMDQSIKIMFQTGDAGGS
jgi:hypothetical protein